MRKTIGLIIVCLVSFCVTAQQQIIKDTLSTTVFVMLNEKVAFENYEFKFSDVITDSRCPKNAMCVRAGEAFVSVSVYKNGSFIEDKKLKINASGYAMETTNLIINTENFKAYGFNLWPYPSGNLPVNSDAYELEFVFKLKY